MCLLGAMTFDLIFYWRMISSVFRRYLIKHLLDCFHVAYKNPSGGVDMPFGVCDLDLFFTSDFDAIIDFN